MADKDSPSPGLSAERGVPAIDPTANVIALTEAAVKRLDDLATERGKTDVAEIKRIDAAVGHIHEMLNIRAEHYRELGAMESTRLNAIRQVDVLAVNTAADRAQAAIQALAAVTTSNAENVRNALNATATTIATQLNTIVTAINERLTQLEKNQYTGMGKQAVADPQIAEAFAEMKKLGAAGASNAGRQAGLSMGAAILIGVVSLIAALVGIAGVLYASMK